MGLKEGFRALYDSLFITMYIFTIAYVSTKKQMKGVFKCQKINNYLKS